MKFSIIIVPLFLVPSLAFDVSQTSNQKSHRQNEMGSSKHTGQHDGFIDTIIRNNRLKNTATMEIASNMRIFFRISMNRVAVNLLMMIYLII